MRKRAVELRKLGMKDFRKDFRELARIERVTPSLQIWSVRLVV